MGDSWKLCSRMGIGKVVYEPGGKRLGYRSERPNTGEAQEHCKRGSTRQLTKSGALVGGRSKQFPGEGR